MRGLGNPFGKQFSGSSAAIGRRRSLALVQTPPGVFKRPAQRRLLRTFNRHITSKLMYTGKEQKGLSPVAKLVIRRAREPGEVRLANKQHLFRKEYINVCVDWGP
ncbi:hypothetical protein RUM44_011551 [Polyplax serrata]|uniref:Uncharacterized protein n=1 Tax=Polyplax serrata TaxID=468196 RepID=A0ABR1AR16_POLSC